VDNNANAMLYGRFGVTPADVFEARGLAFHPEVKALIDDLNTRTPPPGARQAAAPAATTVPIQAPPQAGPAYSAPVPAAGPAAAAPPLVPVR
jgi:hypothetical protein